MVRYYQFGDKLNVGGAAPPTPLLATPLASLIIFPLLFLFLLLAVCLLYTYLINYIQLLLFLLSIFFYYRQTYKADKSNLVCCSVLPTIENIWIVKQFEENLE